VNTYDAAAAVTDLRALDASDPEKAHAEADQILLDLVPTEVVRAYQRLQARCKWWTVVYDVERKAP
jgi:hypothetical protein